MFWVFDCCEPELQAVRSKIKLIIKMVKKGFMLCVALVVNDLPSIMAEWRSPCTFAANVGLAPVFGAANRHESLFYK